MIHPKQSQTAAEVAGHYNSLDQFYRALWGEHVHHGFWETGKEGIEEATHKLIDLVVETGTIGAHTKVCDVGCGYGATARYLKSKTQAEVTALTISKAQWEYALKQDRESKNPRYILGDFLNSTLPSNSFDVVISIESSEHMEDKQRFFEEVYRILKPGGRFVTCAWLSAEAPKKWEINLLLEPICREGRLPNMGSESDYRYLIKRAGLIDTEFSDISRQVKKTWAICARRACTHFFSNKTLRKYLLSKESSDRIFAKTLFRIWAAYGFKSMRYGLFSAKKP
jgi:tocopherol O-methyltransferase